MSEQCTADGCVRPILCKGYCSRHYMRLRRTGQLATVRHTGDFWDKVKKGEPSECWPWTGYIKPGTQHGLTSYKSLPMHTSRKAWLLTKGPIPRGLCVCHKCDNGACCNTDHMYLGTAADNALDTHEQPPFDQRGPRDRSTILAGPQLDELWRMRRHGATLKECGKHFNVHFSTIARYVTEVRRRKLVQMRQRVLRKPQNSQAL